MADVATMPQPPSLDNATPDNDTSDNATAAPAQNTDEAVTVFHDPNNFNVKHPLGHQWTLWFTKPPSGKVRPKLAPSSIIGTDTYCSKTGTSCSRRSSRSTRLKTFGESMYIASQNPCT